LSLLIAIEDLSVAYMQWAPHTDHHGHHAQRHQVYHVQNMGITSHKQNRCNCSLTNTDPLSYHRLWYKWQL
jgi:hypothetical protein